METVRELIDFLRKTADDLEERLEYEEISDKLNINPNTYGLSHDFISTVYGFIDLHSPSYHIVDEGGF